MHYLRYMNIKWNNNYNYHTTLCRSVARADTISCSHSSNISNACFNCFILHSSDLVLPLRNTVRVRSTSYKKKFDLHNKKFLYLKINVLTLA